MNMKKKVSVIIPVYNVELYLERCVESVLNQTLFNFEVILVDDGSPDKCPDICDHYASVYDNVKVVHKKNGGLASARNAGIKVASGEYILFVDSDDWIDVNTLEELTALADKYNVDFVRFRPMYAGWPTHKDGELCDFGTEDCLKEGLYNKEDIKRILYPRLFATSELILGPIVAAWRSLYKTEFLINNELYFDNEVKYSEDTIFSAKVVMATNKFYYLDGARYYHYFYNASSITKSFKSDRWEAYKKLIDCFEQSFSKNPEYDFSKQLWLQKLYCIVSALGQIHLLEDEKKKIQYCKTIFADSITRDACKHLNLVKVPLRLRIKLELIKLQAVRIYVKL